MAVERFESAPGDTLVSASSRLMTPPPQAPPADGAPPLRTVLFVAYHYPPMRSPGVERSARFTHYLPEFGYQPRVVGTGAFGKPGDGVIRAWEPLGLYRRLFNPAARARGAAATRTRTRGPVAGLSAGARRWLLVPDGQITWVPGAALAALRWVRRHGAELIYTTSPPASAHLLGGLLKAQTGLPWIADFRDAWLYDPLDPALLEMPFRRELERRLEERVIAEADAVIAATRTAADDFVRRYPAEAARVRVITNGFDPADDEPAAGEADLKGAPVSGRLSLVHTGSFAYSHPGRSIEPLERVLRRLIDTEPAWCDRLEVILVGELSPAEQERVSALVELGVVRLTGAVDRATALAFQRRADVLLLVDHPRPWPASNAPGKLFEYLAAGHPILALCGEGETRRTVEELGAGLCAAPGDTDAIEASLRQLWAGWREGSLPRAQAGLERFHRRELTRRLADCFDEVLGA